MFTNNNLTVLNFSPIDVVITPVGVPVPLVNLAFSICHIPSQFKSIFGCGLAENLLTQGTTSLGDQAGVFEIQTAVVGFSSQGVQQYVALEIVAFRRHQRHPVALGLLVAGDQ